MDILLKIWKKDMKKNWAQKKIGRKTHLVAPLVHLNALTWRARVPTWIAMMDCGLFYLS